MSHSEHREYSLDELADRSELQARTIRGYIQQGLLPGPESLGRNARYGPEHLKRLEIIKDLKDRYGLRLADIRRLLTLAADDEEIRIVPVAVPASEMDSTGSVSPTDSALEFIRSRQAEADSRTSSRRRSPRRSPSPSPGSGPLERLLEAFRDLGKGRGAPRKVHGEQWLRLPVTPDFELQVRGHLSREQQATLEQLADQMRHVLIGRKEN